MVIPNDKRRYKEQEEDYNRRKHQEHQRRVRGFNNYLDAKND